MIETLCTMLARFAFEFANISSACLFYPCFVWRNMRFYPKPNTPHDTRND